MAALNKPSEQLTLLNATDMVAGQVFTFDRQTLDDVCMDYDRVPVSLGVTASAAFPIRLHARPAARRLVSAAGVPGTTQSQSALPRHIAGSHAAPTRTWSPIAPHDIASRCATRSWSSRAPVTRFLPIETRSTCVLSMAASQTTPGLTALRRALLQPGAPADIGRLAAQSRLRHLVVIAVNARSDPKSDLDNSTRTPPF